MAKVLVNDKLAPDAVELLRKGGLDVDTDSVPQEQLAEKLPAYDAIIVRSATKVPKAVIEACPDLKLIARAGVGLDNIDVEYASSKGIEVINTPAASSRSVAELVFAHLAGMVRYLHASNRHMPGQGHADFKALKKKYSDGTELYGKTLGMLGLGRIGQETARIALGVGMEVIAHDPYVEKTSVEVPVGSQTVKVDLLPQGKAQVLAQSDVVTLHVPHKAGDPPVIGQEELAQMKDGAYLLNCARGGAVSEEALLEALNNDKLTAAALDVFENEPTPSQAVLQHPRISLSPHIGASTREGQQRVGTEMAEKVIAFFK